MYRKSRVKIEKRSSDMSRARVTKKKNDAYRDFAEHFNTRVTKLKEDGDVHLSNSKNLIRNNVVHKIEQMAALGWQNAKLMDYLKCPFDPSESENVPVTPVAPAPSTSSNVKEVVVKDEPVTPAPAPAPKNAPMETAKRPPQIPQREMNFFTPAGPLRLPNFITPKVDDLLGTRFRPQRFDEVGFSVNGSPLMLAPPVQISDSTALISEVLNADEGELTPYSRQIQANLKQLLRKKASMMNETMAAEEAKARKKLEEADKKAKGGGGFFGKIFSSGGSEDAADLYVQAGNMFKMAKLWDDAAKAFVKAAQIHGPQGDSKHECASQYAEAANCYKKVNPQAAVDCYKVVTDIYTDMGRFNMAAKIHVNIAEMYEAECPDTELCIQHYQKAADYYKGEESKSSASKCLVKVAQYAAQLEQYQKAISVFEEIAFWEADHPTLKYNAKNSFFKALLCYLCIDPLDTSHALKRYEEASPSFTDTREAKFIKEILSCIEEESEENFTEAVKNYDKISRLDPWQTSLLVKVKRGLSGEDEDDLK